MLLAAALDVATAIGIYAAASTTVIGLIVTLYKWSWFRDRFITPIISDNEHRRAARIREVLEESLPGLLQPILHELRPNGGSSFRDDVNKFMAATKAEQEALRQDNIRLSNMVLTVVTSQAKVEQAVPDAGQIAAAVKTTLEENLP